MSISRQAEADNVGRGEEVFGTRGFPAYFECGGADLSSD